MGAAYHARQLDLGRDVFIKQLKQDQLESPRSIERFKQEFKSLSRLSDPHIMRVYGLELDDHSNLYAVCEYLEGKSLRELLLEEKKFDWRRSIEYSIQIARALQNVHAENLVHRDLKPENVMLVGRANPSFVKLVDFGIVKRFDSAQTKFPEELAETGSLAPELTRAGELIGTVIYMSPEQAFNKVDARSDIYSLACVLFEMLSGEFLFHEESAAGTIIRHRREDPTMRLRTIEGQLPLKLLSLLFSMLAKDPNKRPQNAKELEDSLQSILDSPGEFIECISFKQAMPLKKVGVCLVLALISMALITAALVLHKQALHTNDGKRRRAVKRISSKAVGTIADQLRYLSVLADDCDVRSWTLSDLAYERSERLCRLSEKALQSSKTTELREQIKSFLLRGLLSLARQQNARNECSKASATLEKAKKLMFEKDRGLSIQKLYYASSAAITGRESDFDMVIKLVDDSPASYAERVSMNISASMGYLKKFSHPKKALQCIESAIESARYEETETDLCKCLAAKLFILRNTGANSEIIPVRNELLTLLSSARSENIKAVAEIAESCCTYGDFATAELLLLDLQRLCLKKGGAKTVREYPHVLYSLARVYGLDGKTQEAILKYDQLLAVYDQRRLYNDSELAPKKIIELRRRRLVDSKFNKR